MSFERLIGLQYLASFQEKNTLVYLLQVVQELDINTLAFVLSVIAIVLTIVDLYYWHFIGTKIGFALLVTSDSFLDINPVEAVHTRIPSEGTFFYIDNRGTRTGAVMEINVDRFRIKPLPKAAQKKIIRNLVHWLFRDLIDIKQPRVLPEIVLHDDELQSPIMNSGRQGWVVKAKEGIPLRIGIEGIMLTDDEKTELVKVRGERVLCRLELRIIHSKNQRIRQTRMKFGFLIDVA